MIRYRNGAYEIVVHVGPDPVTGKPRRVSRSVRMPEQKRTPRTVLDVEAELRSQVNAGQHGSPDVTVGELLDRWLLHVEAGLSPTTLIGYRRTIRLYLRPSLGKVKLAKLTTARIDGMYRELSTRGGAEKGPLRPATVRQCHAVLHRALTTGQRWGWIVNNPAALAEPPSVTRAPMEAPTAEQVAKLLVTDDLDLHDLIACAVGSGARRGELCGMRWTDLTEGELVISRSIVEDSYALIVKAPKTGKARKIPVGENLAALLKARRLRLSERALRFGAKLHPQAYILSTDVDGSKPLHPNLASDRFRRHARRVGVPVRLHDLRHAAATNALAAGCSPNDVAAFLGHSTPSVTVDVYGHSMPSGLRKVGDLLDAALG